MMVEVPGVSAATPDLPARPPRRHQLGSHPL